MVDPSSRGTPFTPRKVNIGRKNDQWRDQLHHADVCVSSLPLIQRATLSGFREEKADIPHAGGKVSALANPQSRAMTIKTQ